MAEVNAAVSSTMPRTLRRLDRRIQQRSHALLAPVARRRVHVLREALGQEPGILIARYRTLQPLWLRQNEAFSYEIATLALETATNAFLRQLRRHYGAAQVQRLLGAEGDEEPAGEGGEEEWPGIDSALAGLTTQLLYQPDAWGVTVLERLTRQDRQTSREVFAALQHAQRAWQMFVLVLGGLLYAQGAGLKAVLRDVESAGRAVLRGNRPARRRLLDILHHARREAAVDNALLSRQRIDEVREAVQDGYETTLEDILTEHLEGRALRRAELLARTLGAQAFMQAQIALAKQAGVTHMRWSLSQLHPHEDVCDTLVGIYPLAELPAFPAHPRCLCLIEPVWPAGQEG